MNSLRNQRKISGIQTTLVNLPKNVSKYPKNCLVLQQSLEHRTAFNWTAFNHLNKCVVLYSDPHFQTNFTVKKPKLKQNKTIKPLIEGISQQEFSFKKTLDTF